MYKIFFKSLADGDTEAVEDYLNKLLNNTISVLDVKARAERLA